MNLSNLFVEWLRVHEKFIKVTGSQQNKTNNKLLENYFNHITIDVNPSKWLNSHLVNKLFSTCPKDVKDYDRQSASSRKNCSNKLM